MLLLEPHRVIAAAGCDELRIAGSQMDNSDQLLSKLRLAVARLNSDAVGYLNARPGGLATYLGLALAISMSVQPRGRRMRCWPPRPFTSSAPWLDS